ncbi:hypothetical protein EDB85DRAFT_2138419 [Lactarius pseudohatsudake]|nr:hypothetical protein EDB85DRAFT_2138419 [Lactarius pseudohatsudake]
MDVVRVKPVCPARLRPAPAHAALSLTRNLHTSTLDRFVLNALSATPSVERPDLPQLIRQYLSHSGKVLGTQLAYESRPSSSRRVSFSDENNRDIHLVAHVAREGDRNNLTLSSGFAIDASDGRSIIVTCAHTLEEIRWSPLLVLPDVPHPSPLTSPPDLSHVRSSGSGGPIVDENSGAVVGVMLGSRMDSSVEGMRGWGIPAEAIFEMFRLPGVQ